MSDNVSRQTGDDRARLRSWFDGMPAPDMIAQRDLAKWVVENHDSFPAEVQQTAVNIVDAMLGEKNEPSQKTVQ